MSSIEKCQFLTHGDQCTENRAGYCVSCGIPICNRHIIATSAGVMCLDDAAKAKDDIDRVTPIIEYPDEDDAFWDQIS